jgi:hypothetical protein
MALSIQLPLQAIQYISTANLFSAPFNTVVAGKYSFNPTTLLNGGNVKQTVIPMEIGSVYLIERMFVSGNIPAEDFLSSVNPTRVDLPQIRITRKIDGHQIHAMPIPVIQFTTNRESPIMVYSDKKGDELQMSMTGVIEQIPNTIGVDPVVVTIGLSIYQINEKFFNNGLKTAMSSDFGLSKKFSS